MDLPTGCLLITHLPVKAELARRPELAGRPVIVAGGDIRRRVVTDAAPEAMTAEVRAGQPLTEALSHCADGVALAADETYLSEINDALLAALLGVADRVEPSGLGRFYLDLTGLAPTYGGETALASVILAAIDAGWQPRLGLAMGKFPAYCAAASAKPGDWLKAPADAARWLAPWPASWLPLPPDALSRLNGFGIRTLGDIAALTSDALSDFLGRVGELVWQLSQGVDTDPVHPVALPEVLRERLEFPFPVDTAPGWEAGVRTLSERVWRHPALRSRSATEVLLEGEKDAGGVWRFQHALPRAASTAEGLSAALLAALNAQDSRGRGRWPDAALLDLSLTVSGLTPLRGRQTSLWPTERHGASVPIIAGVERPVALSPDSPLPERRWALGSEFRPLGQPSAVIVSVREDCPKSVGARRVERIIDLWEVDTEWWTPEAARRRYWQTLLSGGGLATVYHNLYAGTWRRQGADVSADSVELCAHSWFSFGAGASSVVEMVARAAAYGYPALGLTDVSNFCGALEFGQECRAAGIQPLTGVELPVREGDAIGPVTFLAETGAGYANLCRLVSLAHLAGGRTAPELDFRFLEAHAEGVIALLGAPDGLVAADIAAGRWSVAEERARAYRNRFGAAAVFLLLQQHLVHGDTRRNRRMSELARRCGVGTVAANAPWYHDPSRARLHDALTSIRLNASLSEVRHYLKVNTNYGLLPPNDAARRFHRCPDALVNTLVIAERCSDLDLVDFVDGHYRFPDAPTPPGYDAQSWLERLCAESAQRRYGSIDRKVQDRLDEEFALIRRHGLAGFFLVYHRIVELARDCMLELGYGHRETPLEWLPPGRGRGSSVSMLVGYLIGLSHVDPLAYGLTLDRFLSSGSPSVPDIDLDFPRDIRERLILRVIEEWGWDHAALTGMFPTYKARGVVRDLGKALGLPADEVGALARRLESNSVAELPLLPGYAELARRPGWKYLFGLADTLAGFPKGLAQHPGGMLVSSTPLTDFMPVQPSAIDGRYVGQWDKDTVDDAGLVKIDLLALGALSQLQQAVRLVRSRTGHERDLSRIDYRDEGVFDDLGRGDTVGVFQVESAAQMQIIVRMRPENIYELALEIAAVRPGVGAHDGIAEFLRRRNGMPWNYDHPLERHALKRSQGVILFQDQVVQLGMDVGGLTAAEADRMRRAFGRRNGETLVAEYRERFITGARERGVSQEAAETVFGKFNPHYMFPEGHALAFAFTAYQMAWLRRYHPLEFFVGLFNEQPMGFWDLDTLKQDARRLGLRVAHPDVNRSEMLCTAEGANTLRLGLTFVKGVDARLGETLLRAREAAEFRDLPDLLARSGLPREALENLARAGALDGLDDVDDRRQALWQVGAGYVADVRRGQLALALPAAATPAAVSVQSRAERMLDEYALLGLCPDGQIMEVARPLLGPDVLNSDTVQGCRDGDVVRVAGRVVRRQRPLAKAVFLTLEDEWGLIPIAVWEGRWERLKHALRRPLVVIEGTVSRRDNTLNVMAERAWPLSVSFDDRHRRQDWR